MSELPYDPIDELLHRAHNEAQGAPASFKGRLRARMAAEAAVRRQSRLMLIKVGVAIAALLIVGVAVGMNVDLFLPEKTTIDPQPQARSNEPAPEPQPVAPTPQANQPADEPEPVDQPEPKPEPEPESTPEPQPEKPEPKLPDEVKKDPPNVPDEPHRLPEPEPQPEPKPDDVVEKPQPEPEPKETREPEGTEVKPEMPDPWAVLVTQIGDAKFKFRYADEDWQDYNDEKLKDGVSLKAGRKAVDMQLNGGGLVRFNGEVTITLKSWAIRFEISDDSLYVDNMNTKRQITVVAAGQTAEMDDGVGVFYLNRGGLEVACLEGKVALEGERIEQDKLRRATDRAVSDLKPWRGDHAFLRDLPERVLVREDFDEPPPGGMYDDGERLEDGIAIMDKAPRYLAFNFEPKAKVLPGMILRFRCRVADISKLELELFKTEDLTPLKKNQERLFKHIWQPEKQNEWQVIELRVEEIPDHDHPDKFPEPGDELRNFKLHYTGGDKAKLEIDWVEFVRVQDQDR